MSVSFSLPREGSDLQAWIGTQIKGCLVTSLWTDRSDLSPRRLVRICNKYRL